MLGKPLGAITSEMKGIVRLVSYATVFGVWVSVRMSGLGTAVPLFKHARMNNLNATNVTTEVSTASVLYECQVYLLACSVAFTMRQPRPTEAMSHAANPRSEENSSLSGPLSIPILHSQSCFCFTGFFQAKGAFNHAGMD